MIALPPLSSLIQRTKISSWKHIPAEFGDRFFSLDGGRIARGDRLTSDERTPALLSNAKSTLGDLIPRTSWGSSLSNLLTWDSWNALRKPLIARNNNVCELCGSMARSLDVHEVWSYHYPERGVAFRSSTGLKVGVQCLEGLMTLCSDCHKCFHLGRAHIENKFDLVMKRLMGLNNWDKAQADKYYQMVSKRWDKSNQYAWFLDFSGVEHPAGLFEVKPSWSRPKGESGTLWAENKFGPPNYTAILNQSWKIYGETAVEPALSFEQIVERLDVRKRA